MRMSFVRKTLVTYIHTFAWLQLGKQDDIISEEGELILTDNPFLVFTAQTYVFMYDLWSAINGRECTRKKTSILFHNMYTYDAHYNSR